MESEHVAVIFLQCDWGGGDMCVPYEDSSSVSRIGVNGCESPEESTAGY